MSNYPRLAFISAFVQQVIKTRNLSFVYQGEPLLPTELADPNGFLPVFLESALSQMSKVSQQKWNPAVDYLYKESSICYLVPLPQVVNFPLVPLTLFVDFAVEKYVEDFLLTQQPQVVQAYKAGGALVLPLDGLIDNFMQRYQDGKLKVFTAKPSSAPSPALEATVKQPATQVPQNQAQTQAQG